MAGEEPTLDSVLAQVLANSGAVSPQDAVLVVLHSTLLSARFVCVATGDEVGLGPEACCLCRLVCYRSLGVWK